MVSMSTPIEVDTKLAELHQEYAKLESKVESAAVSVAYQAGGRYYYKGNRRVMSITLEDAVETLEANPEAYSLSNGRTNRQALEEFEKAKTALGNKVSEIEEQNKLYTGWSRFFLVTSSNGHIHNSRHCSTCRPTTTFGWLPYLSGKDESEAIDFFGPAAEALCSVCFPYAPVAKDQNLLPAYSKSLMAGERPQMVAKKEYCPGSGKQSATKIDWRRMSPSGKCSHCGEYYGVTQNGAIRKHKPKKA